MYCCLSGPLESWKRWLGDFFVFECLATGHKKPCFCLETRSRRVTTHYILHTWYMQGRGFCRNGMRQLVSTHHNVSPCSQKAFAVPRSLMPLQIWTLFPMQETLIKIPQTSQSAIEGTHCSLCALLYPFLQWNPMHLRRVQLPRVLQRFKKHFC